MVLTTGPRGLVDLEVETLRLLVLPLPNSTDLPRTVLRIVRGGELGMEFVFLRITGPNGKWQAQILHSLTHLAT